MSMRYPGLASLNFIMGIRLCPPLKILASSPYCCRKAIASGTVFGLRYSKAGGIIVVHPPIQAPSFRSLDADEKSCIWNLCNWERLQVPQLYSPCSMQWSKSGCSIANKRFVLNSSKYMDRDAYI